jgi:hypothetical protein
MDFEGTRSSAAVPRTVTLDAETPATPEEAAEERDAPKALKPASAENNDWGGMAVAVAGLGLVLGLAIYLLARVF